MSPGAALLLWLCTFGNVFLLGVQSRAVHSGAYVTAAFNSFLIAASSLVFVRGAVIGDPAFVLLLTGTAGPCGICLSIWFWQRAPKWLTRQSRS